MGFWRTAFDVVGRIPELLRRTKAVPYDHPFRYLVPSTRDPEEKYLVEIDAFDGNGQCVCRHFVCRCEPLLRRGIGPRLAVEAGMIKLKVNRHVEDALRCEHILTARSQFLDGVLKLISDVEKKETAPRRRAA